MNATCGRLIIAGTGSGVGKTSIALGLVRALCRRGHRVQPLKVGPDFLDPTYLALAAGRTCYNLDGWMMGREYVERLFDRTTRDADVAVIEGVMGMFDGADPATLTGSTAEIAAWLDAPVLLVVDAHGRSRSLAAEVKGFAEFEPAAAIAGVIANRVGSDRHAAWLAESLESAALPPLVGVVPRDTLPSLPSRHLGLVTADENVLPAQCIERLADACEEHLDLDAVLSIAGSAATRTAAGREPADARDVGDVRIGVARDEAFHFVYPDNLESLEKCGAAIVPFSPVADAALPADLAGLYLPGGYPEEYAERLSANRTMRESIRAFAESGRPVYAECGGLMYLGRALEDREQRRHEMAGVLPIVTRMLPRRKSLGYVEVAFQNDTLFGPAGHSLRGHEFHYSEMIEDDSGSGAAATAWQKAYSVTRRRTEAVESEGFQRGSVLAGYAHLHWACSPGAADHFVQRCRQAK